MAAALVLSAQQVAEDDPAVWDVAASGFRDTSRVAASDVTMFMDILLTNQKAVLEMIEITQNKLNLFADALESGDENALRQLMEQAAQQRKSLFQ
jgi:prephenate dehydrogenase